MKQKTQERLDRIMQIQQEMYALEKELDRLLGGEEKVSSGSAKGTLGSRRRDSLSADVRKESSPLVKEVIFSIAKSNPRFTRDTVWAQVNNMGIKTNAMQVSQILRQLVNRDALGSQIENGTEYFSFIVNNS